MAEEAANSSSIHEKQSSWFINKLFGTSGDKSAANNETNYEYLHQLSLLSADELVAEPARLEREGLALKDEIETLAFANYRTFIEAANCAKSVYEDFTVLEKNLSNTIEQLPQISQQVQLFLDSADSSGRQRRRTALAVGKHAQLLDVLNMPQLMDTCVRAGYWEEALQLSQYVVKLQRRLGHSALIQKVCDDVSNQQERLLNELLGQLSTSTLTLPVCLRVVGFIRRLGAFSDVQLRVKFLQCRDLAFRTVLNVLPQLVIELSRVHLFDVVTQYKAIFSDHDPFHILSTGQREALPMSVPALLQSWMITKVEWLLDLIEQDVQRGCAIETNTGKITLESSVSSSTRLDSLLNHTLYFGLSFGRIGADFRLLAVPIFERAFINQFRRQVEPATAKLCEELSKNADWLNAIEEMGESLAEAAGAVSRDGWPPLTLLDWPGLAGYCNSLLEAMNGLRQCLLLTMATPVTKALHNSLSSLVEWLTNYARENFAKLNLEHQKRVKYAAVLLVRELIPHINKCLSALFPPKQIGASLGLGAATVAQLKCGRLDAEEIGAPLQSYLPPRLVYASMTTTVPEPIVPETMAVAAPRTSVTFSMEEPNGEEDETEAMTATAMVMHDADEHSRTESDDDFRSTSIV